MICPECAHQMRIISFITEGPIINKILKHPGLWDEERDLQLRKTARAPPPKRGTLEIENSLQKTLTLETGIQNHI